MVSVVVVTNNPWISEASHNTCPLLGLCVGRCVSLIHLLLLGSNPEQSPSGDTWSSGDGARAGRPNPSHSHPHATGPGGGQVYPSNRRALPISWGHRTFKHGVESSCLGTTLPKNYKIACDLNSMTGFPVIALNLIPNILSQSFCDFHSVIPTDRPTLRLIKNIRFLLLLFIYLFTCPTTWKF